MFLDRTLRQELQDNLDKETYIYSVGLHQKRLVENTLRRKEIRRPESRKLEGSHRHGLLVRLVLGRSYPQSFDPIILALFGYYVQKRLIDRLIRHQIQM